MGSHHAPWLASLSTVAGAGAGLVSSIITCPLDVVKTRLQAQKAGRARVDYLGVFGTVKYIWKHNGVKGYYRGLGPTIFGYIPTWAIYFSVYDGIKRHFGENYGEHGSVRGESMALHLTAAMVAGATGSCITNPLWVVKTRFMVSAFNVVFAVAVFLRTGFDQSSSPKTQPPEEVRYRNTLDAFLRIYRGEGIYAFYRGLIPSLVGVSHVAVQFPLYEELKVSLAERQNIQVTDLSSIAIFVCSSISKMTASLVTYPHEVIRTRLQIDYHGIHAEESALITSSSSLRTNRTAAATTAATTTRLDHSHPLSLRAIVHTSRVVYQENGWRGMYRGLSINLLRTVPNSAITLLTYEQIMRYLMRTRSYSGR